MTERNTRPPPSASRLPEPDPLAWVEPVDEPAKPSPAWTKAHANPDKVPDNPHLTSVAPAPARTDGKNPAPKSSPAWKAAHSLPAHPVGFPTAGTKAPDNVPELEPVADSRDPPRLEWQRCHGPDGAKWIRYYADEAAKRAAGK
jgi:hypothetical protein